MTETIPAIPDTIAAALSDTVSASTNVPVCVRIDPNWIAVNQRRLQGQVQRVYELLFIPLNSMGDDGLAENVSVNYVTTDILGRIEQYKTYTGTNNREISMTFHFISQSEGYGPHDPNHPLWTTILPARWLDSLKAPVLYDEIYYAPPPLILSIGNLLTTRVVLTQSTLIWRPPFEPATLYPFMAEVRAVFTVVRKAYAPTAGQPYSAFVSLPSPGAIPTLGTEL